MTTCFTCKKEIDEDHKKGGWWPGGMAWDAIKGPIITMTTHRQCQRGENDIPVTTHTFEDVNAQFK